ncbi:MULTISPECIES: epoxide hydrolase [unclassified Sinorhizobium]|uniref:epoxide hydrolase family protein n=1 Tax=unclassified Sinorhizobium TaxID=2613772 RepID=UPI0024C2655C|nr:MULTISPECIES: epoxide hydrolase [unclassified Sinorhizobium]MDK1373785.1 epoxide hydrolase [Sinorhizobium sp. 6-70]MDK1481819.1 epoxide hydrolase [Sinorhizobium sp. 6-117]
MTTPNSTNAFALSRRALLVNGAVAAGLAATMHPVMAAAKPPLAADAVRPFRVDVPEAELVDLRRRLAATRWPDPETVTDRSQGVQLDKLQALVRYWKTGYDWRQAEAKLNALPQFQTNIDGLDIHFIHVRSRHANALPLIMTHGWPGSIFELLKTIGPLTDPTAHGGTAEDAFHLVLPSIPGFGFSEKPKGAGWNPARVANAWDILMKRLGYSRYVSQGGDWGAIISDAMGRQAPPGLLGIHVNRIERSTTLPPDVAKALKNGSPAPAELTAEERAVFDEAREFLNKGFGYAAIMGTRPQTVGYGLADSPVGLAAWFYDKIADWVFTRGEPERSLSHDEILDNITLYWLTNTGPSSARIYWENNAGNNKLAAISIPAAVTIFPGEVYRPPKSWAARAYHNLIYYNHVDKGGHFAAWEEADLFSAELRAAFRPLRRL